MFAVMAAGRASATTGVAVAAKEMGCLTLVTPREPATRVLRKTKKNEGPVADVGGASVELGASGVQYWLADDLAEPIAVVQVILDAASTCRLQWPQTRGDVGPFAEAAVAFSRKLRSFRTEAGAG